MILSAIAPTCPFMFCENDCMCKKQSAVNNFSCEGMQVGLQQAERTVQVLEGQKPGCLGPSLRSDCAFLCFFSNKDDYMLL